MADCSFGYVVSWICFVLSIVTMAMGFLYVILRVESLKLSFSKCELLEEDCNVSWRQVFTLRPNILLDLWTPVIVGVLGIAVHVYSLRFCSLLEWFLPHGYVGYGIFMIVMALFANFGYCGQLGVILAGCSVLAAILCFIARCAREDRIISVYSKWAYADTQ